MNCWEDDPDDRPSFLELRTIFSNLIIQDVSVLPRPLGLPYSFDIAV